MHEAAQPFLSVDVDRSEQNPSPSRERSRQRAVYKQPQTPAFPIHEGGLSGRSSEDNQNPNDRTWAENDEIYMSPIARRATISKAYSEAEDKIVLQKLDRNLVLFLAFLYLLSFLDRSNIGNARIAGLQDALKISSSQFDLCLLVFYITYITFEWMILLYRLIPPHTYIACCVLCWGLVASCQSLVTSFPQLLTLRAMLGITEAAFGPGVPFYMTFFYQRSELAYRVGLQISAAPLATSFASSLAWVIVKLSKMTGIWEPWRALFLFEGFPSVITAIVAYYWIPDSPSTARWLTTREQKVAALRVQNESGHQKSTSLSQHPPGRLSKIKQDLFRTLSDPKSFLTSLMFFSVNVSFASLPVFLPTIIKSMSFSPLMSQILAAPPYLFAFVFVLLVGHYSDKIPDSRGIFLCSVAALSSLSYSSIALTGLLESKGIIPSMLSTVIRYAAVYPAACGLFSAVVLIITWTLNNQQTTTGKGLGMVVLNVVGQCGPLIGVELFPESQEPFYIGGMVTCAAFMAGVAVLAAGLRIYLRRTNLKNDDNPNYEMVRVTAEDDKDGSDNEEQNGLIEGQNGKVHIGEQFKFML